MCVRVCEGEDVVKNNKKKQQKEKKKRTVSVAAKQDFQAHLISSTLRCENVIFFFSKKICRKKMFTEKKIFLCIFTK